MEKQIDIGKVYEVVNGTENFALCIDDARFIDYTMKVHATNTGMSNTAVSGMLYKDGKEVPNNGTENGLYYISPTELGKEVIN